MEVGQGSVALDAETEMGKPLLPRRIGIWGVELPAANRQMRVLRREAQEERLIED